jgi:hypothetical protein
VDSGEQRRKANPVIDIDILKVKGELPDDVFDNIDWNRLTWCAREAILVQKHEARTAVFDSARYGPNGPILDLDLSPFDAEGWTLLRFQGQPLLRLHVSRLMPGAPLEMGEL